MDALTPPSTEIISPFMKLDASEARSSNAPDSSSGFPILPIGELALI